MKKILRPLYRFAQYALILLVIITALSWYRAPREPIYAQLTFVDIQGNTHDLQKMSEKRPLLVYFWGSWCGICSITSPSVQKLVDDGYEVISIAIESGTPSQLKQYVAQHNYNFIVINDPVGEIFHQWQGQVTPSFVILENGRVKQSLSGIQMSWSLKLRLWINQFL